MQFNAQAAKAAGYSDAEIADFQQGYDAALEAGYTPDEVVLHLGQQAPTAVAASPQAEEEITTYLGGPQPVAQNLETLAAKYNMSVANPEAVLNYRQQYGQAPSSFSYKGVASEIPVAPETEDGGFDPVNLTRSVAKGLTFNFADEAEAAIRSFVQSPFGAGNYYKNKRDINAEYDKWAKDNWKQALAGEMAGGIATLAIPGVGALGAAAKGAQTTGRLNEAYNLAKLGAKYGAGYGAVGGAGASKDMSDIVPSALRGGVEGAVAGAVAGPALTYAGRGIKSLYNKARGIPPLDKAQEGAERQILKAATRDGSIADVKAASLLRQRYGVPAPLGDLSPELQKLQMKVARSPSEGQTEILEDITGTLGQSPERTKGQIHAAFPDANDYFATEEQVVNRLRDVYAKQGEAALNSGQVRDKPTMKLVHNPVMSRYWLKARDLAERRAAAAEARGEDPQPFKLNLELEPVLDAQGALVGLQPTGRTIPDARALDYLGRALKDDADAGFSGTSSAGKSLGAAAADLRKALLGRMDVAVPGYKDYRAAYADEKHVQDALLLGRDKFTTLRPQEVKARFGKSVDDGGYSVAEKQAFATGVVQHLLQPIENPAALKDFAGNIVNSEATREKLKTILPKPQFEMLDAALKLESEAYKGGVKAVSGNPEAQRIAQEIEQTMGEEGAAPGALVSLLGMAPNFTSPGSQLRAVSHAMGMWMKLPWSKRRDAMFTDMAKALREKDTGKIVDLLNSAESHEAARIARLDAEQRRAAIAGAETGDLTEQVTREPTPNAPAVELTPDVGIGVEFGGVPLVAYDKNTFTTPEGEPLSRAEAKALFEQYRPGAEFSKFFGPDE